MAVAKWISTVAAFGFLAGAASAETFRAVSPDGKLSVAAEADAVGSPSLTVRFGEEIVLKAEARGLQLSDRSFGLKGWKSVSVAQRHHREVVSFVAGKTKTAADFYNEVTALFEETDGSARKLALVVRVYDQGIAFRYLVPRQAGLGDVGVLTDRTAYSFLNDHRCWGLNVGSFTSNHEGEIDPVQASQIRAHNLFTAPLVCKTGTRQTTFALAEADVRDFPVSYLRGREDGLLGAEVKLTPRPDNDGIIPLATKIAPIAEAGIKSPWRVVLIGDAPARLPESTLIELLGEPSLVNDTSWIVPGKSAWDWWNNFNAPVANAGINTATYKAYIDFAQSLGLKYVLIDEGWYKGSTITPGPADATQPIAALDLADVIAYGKARGVGIMVWLQWVQLQRQMDEALATYERWGVKGIKVDFMDRTDQDMVDYYHELLKKAANHKLLVDMHGAFPPVGLRRTYPNYIIQEGVMGAEFNKWSHRVTARHHVTMPFTRMALGPVDYTPGGFRNVTPETFSPRFDKPMVMTTRGHGIAMYVVHDSPLVMVSDSPEVYRKADGSWDDGVDFIRDVPTTWDETRVLAGDIGEFIVTARRSGKTWYIGAMTNEAQRTIEVPLSFLAPGAFTATIWQDGAAPTTLAKNTMSAVAADRLTLRLAPSGGATVKIVPASSSSAKPNSQRR